MEEIRKRELEMLLKKDEEKRTQKRKEEEHATTQRESFRDLFEKKAKTVIEPVFNEFAKTINGNGYLAEVRYERRNNCYDRVYLHISPTGKSHEYSDDSRKMVIFRAEVHSNRVVFFDNTIKQLGGEHFPDGDFGLEQLTCEKVEELVFGYVTRVIQGTPGH